MIPTREELDEIAPRHPVLLTRVCHHVHLANSAAFRAAKVAEDAPDPPRGGLRARRFGQAERFDL